MSRGRPPHALVTGGAGYIGSVLCGDLLRRGYRVTVIDSLLFGGEPLLAHLGHPGFAFRKASVCDTRAIRPLFNGVDFVVHLAAIVGYPACAKAGEAASFACNLDGTRNVFELADKAGAKRFVFASTYSNYGLAPDGRPVTEESPLHPQSVYAESKIAAETNLLGRARGSRCAPVILRFATLFGPSPRTRFDLIINRFVLEAIRDGKLVVYQKEYHRSFVHVRDAVRAVGLALEAPLAKVRGEIFNVGSNAGNRSKEEVARLVRKHVPGLKLQFRALSFDGDMRDVRVSFGKIRRVLGFKTTIGVEEGIREMVGLLRSGYFRSL